MLWLITPPEAGCRCNNEAEMSAGSGGGPELVVLEGKFIAGWLLGVVKLKVFEPGEKEKGFVRDGCCLCDATTGTVKSGEILLLQVLRGSEKWEEDMSAWGRCCESGVTTS